MVSLCAGIYSPPPVDRGSRRAADADPRVTSPVPSKAPTALAYRRGGRLQIGTVAAFKSESWPASNRNGGRHQVGKGGRLQLESAEDFGKSGDLTQDKEFLLFVVGALSELPDTPRNS